jgi:hypothetical protein
MFSFCYHSSRKYKMSTHYGNYTEIPEEHTATFYATNTPDFEKTIATYVVLIFTMCFGLYLIFSGASGWSKKASVKTITPAQIDPKKATDNLFS